MAPRSKAKPKRASPTSTGLALGKELSRLRAELKDYRLMQRRNNRIILLLVFSMAGKTSGVPLAESFGSFAHDVGKLWLSILT
ncbi:hypothetical protein APY04_0157 [Hyphomicrobium sulfonivorans]|uniref:Uncharacterized protein n=1 Tax=Hyphomicrobium sulfonivorans TaxID=121290 RepID=A0A109BP44_HYPSL|nr:hypothetical protein [Hyphomicrobium sulfonivorans]KWT72363.1 hypothetical protein APY04_0157 [Hyphomicrobium sulfonivorans]